MFGSAEEKLYVKFNSISGLVMLYTQNYFPYVQTRIVMENKGLHHKGFDPSRRFVKPKLDGFILV